MWAKIAQGAGTSREALEKLTQTFHTSSNPKTRRNALHPLSLTNLGHIAEFNTLNSRLDTSMRIY